MLSPDIFAVADIIWGPHTIDRFSSFKRRQVPRFYSRWLSPFMEHLDAFSASWQGENNWLFPPPSIASWVIKHLMFSKADATLVVPFWPSAPWWPCLTYDGLSLRPEVTDSIVIDPQPNMFIPAVPESQILNYDKPSFRLLLLRLCFCGVHAL